MPEVPVERIRLGTKDDGTPMYHYHCPEGHVVLTGPITGVVEVDGETIDVTAEVVAFDTAEEALAVRLAVEDRYVAEGHPDFLNDPTVPDDGFTVVRDQAQEG